MELNLSGMKNTMLTGCYLAAGAAVGWRLVGLIIGWIESLLGAIK